MHVGYEYYHLKNQINFKTVFSHIVSFQAVDADSTSVIQYSIIAGNSHNIFAIDGRSGEITVTQRNGLDVSALKTDV